MIYWGSPLTELSRNQCLKEPVNGLCNDHLPKMDRGRRMKSIYKQAKELSCQFFKIYNEYFSGIISYTFLENIALMFKSWYSCTLPQKY